MKKLLHNSFAHVGIFLTMVMFFPMVAFGAGGLCASVPNSIKIESSTTSFSDVINFGTCTLERSVIPLMFSIAMVVFLYGIVMFIKEENAEEKEKRRQFMIWGVVAFAVMFSVWGLVGLLENTFGVDGSVLPHLPVSS